ncbi:uncharacterized protein LOC128724352 [Anopheles nili]|uniref:uncharacterized protein LOC128724352 n=1 Tax=Anopheles nili TaxID=185578 RepID=UPI00237B28CA|nr:uncharacterized protein LOC128724352 [Anopheles nili]
MEHLTKHQRDSAIGTHDHEDIIPDENVCSEADDEAVEYDDVYRMFDDMSLKDCFRHLAVAHQLPRSVVNMMLAILRKKLDLNHPKDARTLIGTPTRVSSQVVPIRRGDFWYGGLKSVLIKYVKPATVSNISAPEETQFSLDVSNDGLPWNKSGPTQLWSILMKVVELPKLPIMTVATFSGTAKPASIEEFLRPLVDELNEIQQGGLSVGEKTLNFKVRNFLADSPARSFIKATTSFNGMHGCLKCSCVGEYIPQATLIRMNVNFYTHAYPTEKPYKIVVRGLPLLDPNEIVTELQDKYHLKASSAYHIKRRAEDTRKKVIFDALDAPLRTDAGFRSRVCADHHKLWRSPLEDLDNFDLIKNVPVGERLHLIDLGVTRKILRGLLEGKFDRCPLWSPQLKEAVSGFLKQVQLPSEIHRSLRSVRYVAFWKGTEFRTFLHYTSVVALKDCLDPHVNSHFLLYFCGITILSSSFYQHLWHRAKDFLSRLVKDFGSIYGRTHLTSNVHNLQHVYEEVAMFGPLDDFSAYCFENHLQQIKRWVRSGTKCAEQVQDRANEITTSYMSANISARTYLKTNGIGLHVTADFVLLPTFKDQWFLTKDNGIIKFLEAKKTSSLQFSVVGMRILSQAALFEVSAEGNEILATSSADILQMSNGHGELPPRGELAPRSRLSEVELIVNSRPLTDVPVEDEADSSLTPNHFILGSSNESKPPLPFDDSIPTIRNLGSSPLLREST